MEEFEIITLGAKEQETSTARPQSRQSAMTYSDCPHQNQSQWQDSKDGHPAETDPAPNEAPTHDVPSIEAFQDLQRAFDISEEQLKQKTTQLKDVTKRWKLAARELNELRSQGQGFYQVTDTYLTDLASQLRFNIKSFAIQYFGDETFDKTVTVKTTDYWDNYMTGTTLGSKAYLKYLASAQKRPSVIQAFLWEFLCDTIFDGFGWAGESAKKTRQLYQALRPGCELNDPERSHRDEALQRTFQVWVATTTGLILDSTDTTDPEKIFQTFANPLAGKVRETLDRLQSSRDRNYDENLRRIIYDAIMLDRELCRQLSRVEWSWKKTRVSFDPAKMTLEGGSQSFEVSVNQKVAMVVAPGMMKHGKSTGEDYYVVSMLLPMEVALDEYRS